MSDLSIRQMQELLVFLNSEDRVQEEEKEQRRTVLQEARLKSFFTRKIEEQKKNAGPGGDKVHRARRGRA